MYSVWTYNDIVRSNLHNKGDGFIALEGLGDRILSTTKKIETHFISDKTSNFILIYWGLYKTSGSRETCLKTQLQTCCKYHKIIVAMNTRILSDLLGLANKYSFDCTVSQGEYCGGRWLQTTVSLNCRLNVDGKYSCSLQVESRCPHRSREPHL